MSMKHLSSVFVTVVVLLATVGCNNKVKLGGKVTYADDKSPVTAGIVCFETPTYLARGVLQPDGTYTLSSTSVGDGIPPGKYNVYITELAESGGDDGPAPKPKIALKYTKASTSGLTYEVNSSSKSFDFEIDRKNP